MARIACIDGGMYFHHASFTEPPVGHLIDETIYIRKLADADLSGIDTLIVTCRNNADLLVPLSGKLQDFMRSGGTLVAMGETFQQRWLPEIDFTPVETNFWWWLTPGADLGVRVAAPEHAMFRYLDQKALTWHLHGFYRTTPAQRPLVTGPEGQAHLFEDTETYAPGRLIVTSFDPFFHHGSFFMPATTLFLEGFMQWLKEEPGRPATSGPG